MVDECWRGLAAVEKRWRGLAAVDECWRGLAAVEKRWRGLAVVGVGSHVGFERAGGSWSVGVSGGCRAFSTIAE